ncbi:hypothetical protein H2204_001686 [Knufia peltigerae]|uniref:Uncharacterized protein n=1 Tax=Knufia peltigerae TaxID=1002370 RepID=A0AA38YD14_9EURO|nr:hypothetical protein H2204_001686 [Knufia peltigerae]
MEIFFACAKLGAYATLINYAASASELNAALLSTSPKMLFTTLTTSRYDYISMLNGLTDRVSSLEHIIILEDISGTPYHTSERGFLSYQELFHSSTSTATDMDKIERNVKCASILNLQFTSGSTGSPKAAALTHHGMVNSARFIGIQMNLKPTDRIVIPVPLFHAFGLIIGVCTAFVHGASAVLPSEYFDAGATLSAVDRFQCTGLYGVTTMFVDEMSHPLFTSTKRTSLRFGIMAGSAMHEELLNRVMTSFPIPELYTNWGMTELSSIATMTVTDDSMEKMLKTAGKLLPHFEAKIVEPNTGRTLPWGQRGEIVVSGFGVMHSYYGNEIQTRNTIRTHPEDLLPGQLGLDDNGCPRRWMHTGDEGYLDDDGYFVITGRIKDLIIRGGENISPMEIEARLYEHPLVKQAVVFGVPSGRYGEEVAAMLELEDKCVERPSDKEIKSWVRESLSRYKVPVHIWWLGDKGLGIPTEWPKTTNGKLRKADIRAIGEGE